LKISARKRTTLVSVGLLLLILLYPIPVQSQDYQQQIDRLAEEIAATVTKVGLKNIAVLDFTDLQGNTPELGRFLAEELTTSLVLKDRSFKTIARSNLRTIIQEQKLSATGIINPDDIKRLKISGVDGLIRGTITRFEESIRITLQVIAVENGQIVGAARGTVPKTSAMEGLGSNIESSSDSSPRDGGSSSRPTVKSLVSKDKDLRVSIKFLRKSADSKVKAIFLFENLRDTDVFVWWYEISIVDDQGEQWRLREGSEVTRGRVGLAPGEPLDALLIIFPENGTSKGSRFNIVGSVQISDGNHESVSHISFSNVPLGI
jgi:TolB-like protein